MAGFFERWRALSGRLFNSLAMVFGILSILGGIDLLTLGGPIWTAVLFIVVGTAILAGCIFSKR